MAAATPSVSDELLAQQLQPSAEKRIEQAEELEVVEMGSVQRPKKSKLPKRRRGRKPTAPKKPALEFSRERHEVNQALAEHPERVRLMMLLAEERRAADARHERDREMMQKIVSQTVALLTDRAAVSTTERSAFSGGIIAEEAQKLSE